MNVFSKFTLNAVFLSVVLSLSSFAQTSPTVRLRGSIKTVNDSGLVFQERGGETVQIKYAQPLSVQEVYPIEISQIVKNSFIGTAAVTDKSGRLVALEVHVFPESMRGTGEGHRPWDSIPGSTMTNAAVDELVSVGQSRELHLKYKDGEKVVFVPDNVPIVAFKPADRSLLVPGAYAMIIASEVLGQPTATRIVVGRDGFKPPM
jgi:hypothetical protein